MPHPWVSLNFQLSYPVTRVYPWHYFTSITAGISFVVLTIITLLNVVVSGYNNVTVLSQDYDFEPHYWWSPFITTHNPHCQSHQFLVGDTFNTNVSLFQYSLLALEQSGQSPLPAYGFAYTGTPLNAICNHPLETNTFGVLVNRLQKTVQSKALIVCFDVSQDIQVLALQMSWSMGLLSADRNFLSYNPSNMTFIDILSALAVDLLVGVVAASANTTVGIDSFVASGHMYCPEYEAANGSWAITPNDAEVQQCQNSSTALYTNPVQFSYSNDTVLSSSDVPAVLDQSIANYLQALNAAVLADIGLWYPNNIFASPGMFNATIAPNDAVDAALTRTPALSSFYTFENQTTSAASLMRKTGMIPGSVDTSLVIPSSGQKPATIALSYLCQVQRIKSPLNLIISVIVADASMFTAFYAFWTLAASVFARRKSREANVCEGHMLCRDSFVMKNRTSEDDPGSGVSLVTPAYKDEWEQEG